MVNLFTKIIRGETSMKYLFMILNRFYTDDMLTTHFYCSETGVTLTYLYNMLINKHPNIKFTCENEINGTIYFLDIKIFRLNIKFITSVYR